MGSIVVYYSLEGNTEYIAEKISEKLGADMLRIDPKKAYRDKGLGKFFWGGKSAMMAEKPELMPYMINFSIYERVIIGFPVWAGNFTPPIRTFIEENKDALKGKKISAFACQSGAGAVKALEKLRSDLGIEDFEATAVFIDPKEKPSEENKLKLDMFLQKLK